MEINSVENVGFDSTKYPNIGPFAEKTKQSTIRNVRKTQVRFPKEVDEELVRLINDKGSIKAAMREIEAAFGNSFASKCRNRYKTYLSGEPEFTKEEDMLIMTLHLKYNMKFSIIAKQLNKICAKRVQNRFNKLYKQQMSFLRSNYPILTIPPLNQEQQINQTQVSEAPVRSNESEAFPFFSEINEDQNIFMTFSNAPDNHESTNIHESSDIPESSDQELIIF